MFRIDAHALTSIERLLKDFSPAHVSVPNAADLTRAKGLVDDGTIVPERLAEFEAELARDRETSAKLEEASRLLASASGVPVAGARLALVAFVYLSWIAVAITLGLSNPLVGVVLAALGAGGIDGPVARRPPTGP